MITDLTLSLKFIKSILLWCHLINVSNEALIRNGYSELFKFFRVILCSDELYVIIDGFGG